MSLMSLTFRDAPWVWGYDERNLPYDLPEGYTDGDSDECPTCFALACDGCDEETGPADPFLWSHQIHGDEEDPDLLAYDPYDETDRAVDAFLNAADRLDDAAADAETLMLTKLVRIHDLYGRQDGAASVHVVLRKAA